MSTRSKQKRQAKATSKFGKALQRRQPPGGLPPAYVTQPAPGAAIAPMPEGYQAKITRGTMAFLAAMQEAINEKNDWMAGVLAKAALGNEVAFRAMQTSNGVVNMGEVMNDCSAFEAQLNAGALMLVPRGAPVPFGMVPLLTTQRGGVLVQSSSSPVLDGAGVGLPEGHAARATSQPTSIGDTPEGGADLDLAYAMENPGVPPGVDLMAGTVECPRCKDMIVADMDCKICGGAGRYLP